MPKTSRAITIHRYKNICRKVMKWVDKLLWEATPQWAAQSQRRRLFKSTSPRSKPAEKWRKSSWLGIPGRNWCIHGKQGNLQTRTHASFKSNARGWIKSTHRISSTVTEPQSGDERALNESVFFLSRSVSLTLPLPPSARRRDRKKNRGRNLSELRRDGALPHGLGLPAPLPSSSPGIYVNNFFFKYLLSLYIE